MSTTLNPSDQEFSPVAMGRACNVSGMKGLLIVAFAAVLAASAAFAYQQQLPWVEILGKDLLRTNASSKSIAQARDAVIREHQNLIAGKDGKQSDPTYHSEGRTWSIGPSPDKIETTAVRTQTRITDKNDVTLSIEIISVTDTPTLVFIDYDAPAQKEVVVNQMLKELAKQGVKAR